MEPKHKVILFHPYLIHTTGRDSYIITSVCLPFHYVPSHQVSCRVCPCGMVSVLNINFKFQIRMLKMKHPKSIPRNTTSISRTPSPSACHVLYSQSADSLLTQADGDFLKPQMRKLGHKEVGEQHSRRKCQTEEPKKQKQKQGSDGQQVSGTALGFRFKAYPRPPRNQANA